MVIAPALYQANSMEIPRDLLVCVVIFRQTFAPVDLPEDLISCKGLLVVASSWELEEPKGPKVTHPHGKTESFIFMPHSPPLIWTG